MSFAFGQREAILDTNVARVLFRIFVGRGAPKAHAMKRHLWDGVPHGAAASPRLRLQPGADGFRRHALHRAQAEVPDLPDAGRLQGLSVQSRTTNSPAVKPSSSRAAIVEDHGRYFVTRRQKGVHLEGLWEFPGGKCEPGESLADRCGGS